MNFNLSYQASREFPFINENASEQDGGQPCQVACYDLSSVSSSGGHSSIRNKKDKRALFSVASM